MRGVFFGMAVRLALGHRLVLVLRQQRLEAGVGAEDLTDGFRELKDSRSRPDT